MSISRIDTVTIESLKRDENNVQFNNDSYLISYPEFIKYFNNQNEITKHNLIIGINFTYGWMPTIFDFRSTEIDESLKILNQAKIGITPTETELNILKKCFNNSLVGTSKLLHFINPHKFAIWDSRVFRYLTKKDPYSSRIEKCDLYLKYLNLCEIITNDPDYQTIHESMISKIKYNVTPFRSIELIMFFNGK